VRDWTPFERVGVADDTEDYMNTMTVKLGLKLRTS
jgi:hypothetical protein